MLILRCGHRYALRRREDTGLLAGLWEFPNLAGKLELEEAMAAAREMGVPIRGPERRVERKHIFTHIQWNLRGYYLEAQQCGGDFVWLTEEEIRTQAALPTAFRQFWEEIDHV